MVIITSAVKSLAERIRLKITLIALHQISMETQVPLYRCLGILALSAALKTKDIDVELLDLSKFTTGVGLDYDTMITNVIRDILSSKPNVLGFSTMSNNIVMALEICRRIKEKDSEIITILGGPGASFSAGRILSSFKDVDIIVRGESDSALPELISQIKHEKVMNQIKGVILRDGTKIIDHGWPDPIEDLNSLPIPDYAVCRADVDSEEPVTLEVGRGCPFACTFCSTSSFFKRKFRVKSVNRVLEEIKEIQDIFGSKRIKLNHDLLTYNREYMISLCDKLSTLDNTIRWSCSARLDTLDDEILRRMKDAGCDSIYLGIETVTERMQRKINKRLDLSNFEELLRTAIELDFRVILSFVIGFPEETKADIIELWKFVIYAKSIHPLKVIIQIHSLVPEPGSELFETLSENLVYDDYGGPGHSDFPPIGWTHLREMIKSHPDIFPNYYYINSPSLQRENIIRQVYLGQVVDAIGTCSVQFAYSILGDKLAETLVEKIEMIELPESKWPAIDYRVMMDSIRKIILELLEGNNGNELLYDALVQAELAFMDVARQKPDHFEFLETWYHTIEHMNKIMGHEYDASKLDKQPRTIFIFWDEQTDRIAFKELSFELAEQRRKISRLEKE